jgi:lipid A ethanolaminephosphotransferase
MPRLQPDFMRGPCTTGMKGPGDGRFRIRSSVEALVLVAALFWLLAGNQPLLSAALRGRSLMHADGLRLAASLVVGVVALHVLLLGLLAHRHTVKPLVAVLTLATALASWSISRYGIVLDPSMLRNVLRTDTAEAGELLSGPLLLHLAVFALAPIALLTRVELQPRLHWRAALGSRALLLGTAFAVLVLAVLASYQPLAALMRLDKSLRYRITPANVN